MEGRTSGWGQGVWSPVHGPRCLDFICGHQEAAVLFEEGCCGHWGGGGWVDGKSRGGRPGGGEWETGLGQGWGMTLPPLGAARLGTTSP